MLFFHLQIDIFIIFLSINYTQTETIKTLSIQKTYHRNKNNVKPMYIFITSAYVFYLFLDVYLS